MIICLYFYMRICLYVCMCICLCVCIYIYIYTYIHVSIYLSIYLSICMPPMSKCGHDWAAEGMVIIVLIYGPYLSVYYV